MTELNIKKDQTLFQQSQNFLQRGYQKSQGLAGDTNQPVAKFLLGLAVYPIVFASQLSAQACLKVFNIHTYDDLTSPAEYAIELLNPISLSENLWSLGSTYLSLEIIKGVGQELFYREFTQSYLLDKKLSVLLSKISPKMGEYPKTTGGTAIRVVLTSAFFTWLLDYKTLWYQSNARHLNSLIFHVFCGAMKEKTGSILPGVALHMARTIYGAGF